MCWIPATLTRTTLFLAALVAVVTGCSPQYVSEDRTDRREKQLRIEQHAGGTHYATVLENGRWFQTFSNELLVIDSTNGRQLGHAAGYKFGEGGPLVDLAVVGDTAWAVAINTGLVKFDVADNADPKVVATTSAEELGIEPRFISVVGDEIYVTGQGGAVRVSDGEKFLPGLLLTHVVNSPVGLVSCSGRKILALSDGRYLGSASVLMNLPTGVGPADSYAFLLQGQNGASIGIMSPTFAEIDQAAIPASVRRIRICGDRLFAVTDKFLFTWRIDGSKLTEPEEIPLKGGRDIALIRPNHFAVSGTFGRAMYRHKTEDRRIGDTFYNIERQPGLLEVAVSDGRRILAGGREGFWLWRIGGEPELTDKTTDLTTILSKDISATWGSLRIIEEKAPDGQKFGTAVELVHDGITERYEPDGKPKIFSIELIDGDVWIGHDHGLDVLRRVEAAPTVESAQAAEEADAKAKAKLGVRQKPVEGTPVAIVTGKIVPIHTWRFEGPVLFIYPERIGGGGTLVSLHGGFILIKPAAVGDQPVFTGRGEVQ